MSYNMTGLPTYWFGLPTLENLPPQYQLPTSYINWSNWSFEGIPHPTYGNFGGRGYPATPEGMLEEPVNRLDGYFKKHDLGFSNDPAAQDAANRQLVKDIEDNYSTLVGELHPADLLPNLPSIIRGVCSGFGPCRGGLRTRLV